MVDVLISTRGLQLEKQAELDVKLDKCPCREQVAEYLLNRRIVNRDQYKFVHNGGFMNSYQNIQTNLKEIETDHNRMMSILSTDNPCYELRKYLKDVKQYAKKI